MPAYLEPTEAPLHGSTPITAAGAGNHLLCKQKRLSSSTLSLFTGEPFQRSTPSLKNRLGTDRNRS